MKLSREDIIRMVKGNGRGSVSGGGGAGFDPSMLSGLATESWVNNNFLSIDFFRSLFRAYDSASTPNEIMPNDGDTEGITNIKAMFGFWTNQYLSALGQNSSGGGGGGTDLNEPLASINNAGLAVHPATSGQTIVWNGTSWAYGTAGGGSGTVTSIATGTGLTGGPITESGTIAIDSTYQVYIARGVEAYGWGDHAQAGYALAADVYSKTAADAKFMTIAAFENLFNAIGSDGTTKIGHPYASSVASIKAMFGLWTNQYLSALGLNSSGGGGGASTLADLSDVVITSPTNGQALVYDSAAGKWKNGNVSSGSGGTVTSVGMTVPTGFVVNGSPITASGVLGLSFASGYALPTIADVSKGVTAYGWGNHATAGYLTATDAAATYLTISDAASTYLTTANAALTYLTTTNAASTYLAKTDAASTYLTISFFRSLFKAYDSNGTEVQPNGGDTTTIDNIKSLFGFWTQQYLSALGQNSSGSGGGGTDLNEPLSGINNASLGVPTGSGKVIAWNGTTWSYATMPTGTVSSVSMTAPQGFVVNGSPITGSGTLQLTFASGYALPTAADVNKGVTAYGWGNHATAGYLTATDAAATYLTQADAILTYLSISDAASTYLTTANAALTYLTTVNAANTYLSKTDAASTYLTIANAASTYLTQTDAANTYLSIAFFSKLFKAYNGSTEVSPNDAISTIDNIKAMFGFWTQQYLSALGQNSSGSGGATALEDLVDVAISSPSNGQALLYDSTAGKWVNGSISGGSGGTVTSVAMTVPTGFVINGSPITGSGTLQLTFASGYALATTAKMSNWDAAYSFTSVSGFGNAGSDSIPVKLGNTTKNVLTAHQSLVGYATQMWVQGQGYLTSVAFSDLTSHPTTLAGYGITDALPSSTTFWGQTASNGAVKGSLNQVTSIEFNGVASGDGHGGFIDFHFNGSTADYTSRIIENASGVVQLFGKLRIGDALIEWDSTNSCLKVTGGMYATSFVSALGANSSGVDSVSIGTMTIGNQLRIVGGDYTHTIKGDADGNLVISGSEGVYIDNTVYMNEYADIVMNGADLNMGGGDIKTGGGKLYLDGTRYVYVSDGHLYFYNGTTNIQIA